MAYTIQEVFEDHIAPILHNANGDRLRLYVYGEGDSEPICRNMKVSDIGPSAQAVYSLLHPHAKGKIVLKKAGNNGSTTYWSSDSNEEIYGVNSFELNVSKPSISLGENQSSPPMPFHPQAPAPHASLQPQYSDPIAALNGLGAIFESDGNGYKIRAHRAENEVATLKTDLRAKEDKIEELRMQLFDAKLAKSEALSEEKRKLNYNELAKEFAPLAFNMADKFSQPVLDKMAMKMMGEEDTGMGNLPDDLAGLLAVLQTESEGARILRHYMVQLASHQHGAQFAGVGLALFEKAKTYPQIISISGNFIRSFKPQTQ